MNTRKNCPRIVEIEKQLKKLQEEYFDLVKPTEEENDNTALNFLDLRGPEEIKDALGDLFLAQDALDIRETIEEEENESTSCPKSRFEQ